MDEKQKRDYLMADEVLRIYGDKLWKYDGVVSVGAGVKLVGGHPTEDMAVIVGVRKKRLLSEIPEDQRIPSDIEGVKTDILEIGKIHLTSEGRAPLEPFYELPKGAEHLGEDGS